MAEGEKTKFDRKFWQWVVVVSGSLFGTSYVWMVNPLPHDEIIISSFRQHRAEIEKVVDAYRTAEHPLSVTTRKWERLPEVQPLLERAGIKYLYPQTPVWLPRLSVSQDGNVLPVTLDNKSIRRYGTLGIELDIVGSMKKTVRYGWMWKRLYTMPQNPRIEQGQLWSPVDERGKSNALGRVLDETDDFPSGMKPGECVFRPIEPRWFISMCRDS